MTDGTPRAQIPEWFDIKDYSATASFKPSDWHLQLDVRSFLWRNFHPDGPSWRRGFRRAADDLFNTIQKVPVLSFDDISDVTSKAHLFALPKSAPVSQITFKELKHISLYLRTWETLAEIIDEGGIDTKYLDECRLEELVDVIESEYAQQLKHPDDSVLALDDISEDHGFPPGILHTEVNLNYSDDEILSAMKSWLGQMRQKYPTFTQRTRNFSKNEMQRWAEHGVLPYLDLIIWSYQKGVTIRQHTIGNAIFPDEIETDVTEKIRKTTKLLAEQLMTGDTINILEGMSS